MLPSPHAWWPKGASDSAGTAQQVLTKLTSSGDGFSGASLVIGDVEEFAKAAVEAEEDATDGEGDQEEEGEQAGEGVDANKAKVEREDKASKRKALAWHTLRDEKLTAAQEKHTRMIDTLQAGLEEEKAKLEELLKSPFTEAPLVKAHTTKARSIVECCRLVLSDQPDAATELASFIEGFTSPDESKHGGASSSGRRELGLGPPCVKYLSLIAITEWRLLLSELLEVSSPEELGAHATLVPGCSLLPPRFTCVFCFSLSCSRAG